MKAKSARSIKPKETRHVADEAFADLKEALEGALAFERGERRDLHKTRIRAPRTKAVSRKDRERSKA